MIRGMQSTHQSTKIDPTQPVELGWFLGIRGLGWVMKFLLIMGWIELDLGHNNHNPPNPT